MARSTTGLYCDENYVKSLSVIHTAKRTKLERQVLITICCYLSLFSARNMIMFTLSGSKHARFALTSCPAMLNALSDGTDVAGTQRYFRAILASWGNCFPFPATTQLRGLSEVTSWHTGTFHRRLHCILQQWHEASLFLPWPFLWRCIKFLCADANSCASSCIAAIMLSCS